MSRTSKIEWCDVTFNPITGCRHGCPYCYARRMVQRFSGDSRQNLAASSSYRTDQAPDKSGEIYILDRQMETAEGKSVIYPFRWEPTFHRYRLPGLADLKAGKNVFIGAMADMFGEWIPEEWLTEVFSHVKRYPRHNFLFLTKNPARYGQLSDLPAGNNMFYGTTVTDRNMIEKLDHLPENRKTFVSIEPILEDICPEQEVSRLKKLDWIIIGAQTGQTPNKVKPSKAWIENIVRVADELGIPVFMKDSLITIVSEENMRREYPEELLRKTISEKQEALFYDTCCHCMARFPKKELYYVNARKGRVFERRIGFMCEECFEKMCSEYGCDDKAAGVCEYDGR